MHDWFQTPSGRYLLDWERARADEALADVFGYHALQLGLPELDTLRANRMPHRWLAVDQQEPGQPAGAERLALFSDFAALPFPANSLDLVVLPHTLEFSEDPHATLREVERVLVPEGRVLIFGLNPVGWWGLRQWRGRLLQKMGVGSLFLPDAGEFIGYWRLQDWLHLLSLEVEVAQLGCYRPALQSEKWLHRFAWMDRWGARWWPVLGSAYCLVAVKRVRGMRLMEPNWAKAPRRAGRAATIANRDTPI